MFGHYFGMRQSLGTQQQLQLLFKYKIQHVLTEHTHCLQRTIAVLLKLRGNPEI